MFRLISFLLESPNFFVFDFGIKDSFFCLPELANHGIPILL